MAKVLFNMSSQPAGTHAGVARFGMELASNLIARGTHDYAFRSQWTAEQLPETIAKGAKLEVIPPVKNYFKEFIRSSLTASKVYPHSDYDLVFNLDALGMAGGGAHRMTIVHDIYFKSMPELDTRFHRMKAHVIHASVIASSSVVVAISDATAGELRRHFPKHADRVRTILSDSTMNGVTPGALPPELASCRYVMAVANYTVNKNFDVLAQAFARMAGDHPGLKLVHVGGDSQENIATRLAEKGMGDRLIRLRGIDDDTLAAVYAHAECLVVPSLLEGFCLPILEAQRFGCPVIFSKTSAAGEIGGEGGISFDPRSIDDLERHLRDVVSSPELRDRMRERGTLNAGRFSWKRTTDQYEAAILDAIR